MKMSGITDTKFRTGDRAWIIEHDEIKSSTVRAVEVWSAGEIKYWLHGIFGYFNDSTLFKSKEEAQEVHNKRMGHGDLVRKEGGRWILSQK